MNYYAIMKTITKNAILKFVWTCSAMMTVVSEYIDFQYTMKRKYSLFVVCFIAFAWCWVPFPVEA